MPINASTITVHWHDDNYPVYSVDFQPARQPGQNSERLVTGGGDNNVRVWKLVYEEKENTKSIKGVDYLCTLSKHTQAVNVVRFSPKGDLLATAGDDGTIFIWQLSDHIIKEMGNEDLDAKESWILKHACRSSNSEIYDLAWSPDSRKILTGSMDNITRIYDALTGQQLKQIAGHSHYVQGVAWDPKNEFIATQSADRTVNIYKLNQTSTNGELNLQPTVYYKIERAELPVGRVPHSPRIKSEELNISSSLSFNSLQADDKPSTPLTTSNVTAMNPPTSHKRKLSTSSNGSAASSVNNSQFNRHSPSPVSARSSSVSSATANNEKPITVLSPPRHNTPLPAIRPMEPPSMKTWQIYHSETLQSFFRRLTFSPDGSLLATPSGVFKMSGDSTSADNYTNTVYIYTRSGLNRAPVAHLPGLKKPSIVIRFSPILYKLKDPNHSVNDEPPNKTIKVDDSVHETPTRELPSIKTSSSSKPFFKLPYRMVFAVATQDSVIIYDTESIKPISYISNLHYSTLTDLAWSADGETLIITSTDGFCSSVNFTNEFEKYEKDDTKQD